MLVTIHVELHYKGEVQPTLMGLSLYGAEVFNLLYGFQ